MTKFVEKSKAMLFFEAVGLEKISWSLRRFHVPIPSSALVLEVGSGGNPYARSNVLLDAYIETRERHYEPLVSDRKTVLGFGENLPFKNKSFDFVIASHVLEHSGDPEKFLSELERVAKAGYIEVPDAFFERLNPYIDHRLEITRDKNKLVIKKKERSVPDLELSKLYEARVKPLIANGLIPKFPFRFHIRYYWKDKINYEITNPEVDAKWVSTEEYIKSDLRPSLATRFKGFMLKIARAYFSQKRRNMKIDLSTLLHCSNCQHPNLRKLTQGYSCDNCDSRYEERNGIVICNPENKPGSI